MCPRFSASDPHLDMPLETYQRIVDAMGYAHTVDFTGWGEPMLHPEIYQMVAMAAAQGCLTTMTSNGTIFNDRNTRALLEAGMNRLTVSVDGMRKESFEKIRLGADFDKVTANLRRLVALSHEIGGDFQLGIAFSIQEENVVDLPLISSWLESIGAQKLHLKQLNVVSTEEDWDRSFLKYALDPGRSQVPLQRLEKQLLELKQQEEERGIEVVIHSDIPMTDQMSPRHCLATPMDSLYFSYEGRVSPCCHFGHHVTRYFEGQPLPASALFYGDIRRQDFLEIWREPDFFGFRNGFASGDYPVACHSCYLLYGK